MVCILTGSSSADDPFHKNDILVFASFPNKPLYAFVYVFCHHLSLIKKPNFFKFFLHWHVSVNNKLYPTTRGILHGESSMKDFRELPH